MLSRREKIEQMLLREPNDVFLHFSLAMELAKEGRTDEAVSQFDRVVSLDPSYTAARFQKGTTLANAGRREDAKKALRDGIVAARQHGDDHAASEMQDALDSLG